MQALTVEGSKPLLIAYDKTFVKAETVLGVGCIKIRSPLDKSLVARLKIKSSSWSRQSIVSCVHIMVL